MAAQWHTPVRDALDKLVLGCNTNLQGVESVIKSTEGACIDKGKGGQKYKTSKGASHVLLKHCVGSDGCRTKEGGSVYSTKKVGATAADIVLTRPAKHTTGLVIDSQVIHIAGSHILRWLNVWSLILLPKSKRRLRTTS